MVLVKPFAGLRPRKECVKQVSSPPYDVLSTPEARELAKENPNSLLYVTKPEISFPESTSAYSPEVYQMAREKLKGLIHDKIMVRDERESVYIYRLTWRGRSQTGFMLLSSVEDYFKGKIKRHEFTRPDKETDRTKLNEITKSQTGPVFLFYTGHKALTELLADASSGLPEYDFEVDGVHHQLWVVSDQGKILHITGAFAEVEATYIADGHHRCAAAANVCKNQRSATRHVTGTEPFNFFLTVIFPDEQLQILPYHRVVSDLNDRDASTFLHEVSDRFTVDPQTYGQPVEPTVEHLIGMYLDGKWYRLIPRAGSFNRFDPIEKLDTSILTNNLLSPILGITKPRTDKRIDFVGGVRGIPELVRLVDSGKFKVAFAMPPVSLEALKKVADACEVMPPKSTWFEPKLRDGLVVHLL